MLLEGKLVLPCSENLIKVRKMQVLAQGLTCLTLILQDIDNQVREWVEATDHRREICHRDPATIMLEQISDLIPAEVWLLKARNENSNEKNLRVLGSTSATQWYSDLNKVQPFLDMQTWGIIANKEVEMYHLAQVNINKKIWEWPQKASRLQSKIENKPSIWAQDPETTTLIHRAWAALDTLKQVLQFKEQVKD